MGLFKRKKNKKKVVESSTPKLTEKVAVDSFKNTTTELWNVPNIVDVICNEWNDPTKPKPELTTREKKAVIKYLDGGYSKNYKPFIVRTLLKNNIDLEFYR